MVPTSGTFQMYVTRSRPGVGLTSDGLTIQAMYVERNIAAGPCDHCCSVKAIDTAYSECVSVALVI
jgi:hypothetical protein